MNKEEAKKQIDEVINRLEWRHGGGTDYVKNDRTTAHAIIDKIEPDHPKVKLPRDVGEELDAWKFRWGIDIGEYLTNVCTSDEDTPKAQEWREAGVTVTRSTQLSEAFNHGWEAEPEAKWYVQTPKEWWEDKNKPEYVDLDSMGISGGLKCKEYAAQFTRAELKQYHFDSDIFTLVPVENEEVSR